MLFRSPEVNHPLISTADAAALKGAILAADATVPQLVRTAWASASSYRDSDMRGGANGARIRLAPMKDWPINNPKELSTVLAELSEVREAFNSRQTDGKQVSMADMIVLGGYAAIEKAAADAGHAVTVPFKPGRMDASQEFTDVASFSHLESTADGFRNYYDQG